MGKQFLICFRLVLAVVICTSSLSIGLGQNRKTSTAKNDDMAVIRGQVAYDEEQMKSWDGNKLVVPYQEIQAKIRERVVPPPALYPADFAERTPEKRLEWEVEFLKTTRGKKFIEDRKSMIENANAFDVKFEKDGKFVIYDVPAGIYGIQGRIDKDINGKKYAFEVFGEIPVEKGMDEIKLEKMRVEITPLVQPDENCPPLTIKTDNDLNHAVFKDKMVFLNFWYSKSPSAATEQKMIQEMYAQLKDAHPIALVSICVDSEEAEAKKFIDNNELKQGNHAFTGGVNHRTIFDFGVRSYPSFWLIGADRKVMMTQYEVAQAMRVKPNMKTIVEDRILGKDKPTPAKPPGDANQ